MSGMTVPVLDLRCPQNLSDGTPVNSDKEAIDDLLSSKPNN